MSRAGLIINPASGKASGKGMSLAEMMGRTPRVSTRILEKFEQLPHYLQAFASEGVTDLFISSGDGTIQAIQTELAERSPFKTLPRLSLLPHGTTNMTAGDLGIRYRSLRAQAEFIRNLQPSKLRQRPSLRVVNPGDGKPRYGMFLGTGASSEATMFCQTAFNAKGVKGEWATFATLASAAARTMFTKADPRDETRLDRPFLIQVTSGGQQFCSGPHLMMLSTTLERIVLGIKPFWGGQSGPIRTSIFPYPVPSVTRWLLPMMYGGENRRVPRGALSFSGADLEILSSTSFVLDGEFFVSAPGEQLKVETGPVFTYLCG